MYYQQSYTGLKKVVLIALLGIAFVKVEKVKQPILGVSQKHISLGLIPINKTTNFSFKIYNWGNAKLKIDTIMANSPNINIAYSQGSLLENDSIKVFINYLPIYPKEFNESIIIVSNSNTRVKVLPITGQTILSK